MDAPHKRVTLLFNANKAFDRSVISGIAAYLRQGMLWDLYVEEDLITRLDSLSDWEGDGFIADFDNPKVVDFVRASGMPAVGVGGSYAAVSDYPTGFDYVATNNQAISLLGVDHFLGLGYRHFAFYGLPKRQDNKWAAEREKAFLHGVQQRQDSHMSVSVYRGKLTHYKGWRDAFAGLQQWLLSLPKPVGIMAVTDSRARQLLEACHALSLRVPEQVAVLGVDDDELIRGLTGSRLSSIRQGSERMGFIAANLLEKQLQGECEPAVHVVDPVGVVQSTSTDFLAMEDDVVRQAMHFIRMHACDGIQATHVLRHVGYSRATVEARFKRALSSSIHQEIVKIQIARVKHLLLETSLPLKAIAERTGYSTVQYFTMVFKRQVGLTPSNYRALQR